MPEGVIEHITWHSVLIHSQVRQFHHTFDASSVNIFQFHINETKMILSPSSTSCILVDESISEAGTVFHHLFLVFFEFRSVCLLQGDDRAAIV